MSIPRSPEWPAESDPRPPVGGGGLWELRMPAYPAGANQLAEEEIWRLIDDGFARREAAEELTVHALVALPDCLFALIEFHPGEEPRSQMAEFRYWLSECAGIRWQRDWSISQTLGWKSPDQTAAAMRLAAVQAGLVSAEGGWPYRRP